MKKSNRKGFTIVELVIVIAVIAILAAVLIPTFSNIIKKANVSSDTQIIRNANTALAADLTEHKTMAEALEAAEDYGLDISKINAKATGNEILWDSANDVFCYYNADTNKVEYIPETTLTTTADETELWEIIDVTDANPTATISGKKWSLYARSATVDAITVSTGFDAGDCTNFTSITYTNSEDAQEVVIRTNNKDAEIVVNAPLDTVKHYGVAKSVEIKAVSSTSYYEYGSIKIADIKNGRLVITNAEDASVGTIYLSATNDAYDGIIIATMSGAELPTVVQRDAVTETAGKIICTIQTNVSEEGTNPEKTESITIEGTNNVQEATNGYSNASGIAQLILEAPDGTEGAGAAYVGNDISVAAEDKASVLEAATKFSSGDGSEENPYLISSADEWYNLCTLYNWGLDEYPGQYYIYHDGNGCFVKLIADIDCSGLELPYSCSVYGLHLDGQGHTLSNATGACIFDNNGSHLYNDNYITNLKVENCNVDCSIFGYGTKNAAGNTANFENVTVNNCSAQGGTFLYYCGAGTATFKNCTVTNTNIVGGYMASGGYVGNISNGKITIDSCKFGGSVVSTQSICAGFVGQPTSENASAVDAVNVVIKNSEILSGTVIKNVAGGNVAAFSGQNTDRDYAAAGNKFYGTLITNGTAYKEGTNAATAGYTAICTAADFTLNADGSVTYTGSENLEKVVVTQYVTDDYIYYSSYYAGYNWNIESTSVDNLASGGTITGLTKITGLKNVVSSADTPVGLQTLDTTHVDEIYNGTFYFDAQTYSWGHYMLGGTYNSSTDSAIEPSSLNVYVKITVYDANGALDSVVSGASLPYSVDLTK